MSGWPVDRLGNAVSAPKRLRPAGPGPPNRRHSNCSRRTDQSAFTERRGSRGRASSTGRSGSIGKVHYVGRRLSGRSTRQLYVRDFHGNHPKYVFWLLREMKLERYCTGTGVPTLNRNVIHETANPATSALLNNAESQQSLTGPMRSASWRSQVLPHLDALSQSMFRELTFEGSGTSASMGDIVDVRSSLVNPTETSIPIASPYRPRQHKVREQPNRRVANRRC